MNTTAEQNPSQLNSTGILLQYDPCHGWNAMIEFSTWQHADPACIEGSIGMRYYVQGLPEAIDMALAAAARVGVVFHASPELQPRLYVPSDGEGPGIVLPSNWRQLLNEQCERIGWPHSYPDDEQAHDNQPAQQG